MRSQQAWQKEYTSFTSCLFKSFGFKCEKGGQNKGDWVFPTARTEGVRGNVRGSLDRVRAMWFIILMTKSVDDKIC
eukprot:1152710-Pelagomonas_calceolata.AAC.1